MTQELTKKKHAEVGFLTTFNLKTTNLTDLSFPNLGSLRFHFQIKPKPTIGRRKYPPSPVSQVMFYVQQKILLIFSLARFHNSITEIVHNSFTTC